MYTTWFLPADANQRPHRLALMARIADESMLPEDPFRTGPTANGGGVSCCRHSNSFGSNLCSGLRPFEPTLTVEPVFFRLSSLTRVETRERADSVETTELVRFLDRNARNLDRLDAVAGSSPTGTSYAVEVDDLEGDVVSDGSVSEGVACTALDGRMVAWDSSRIGDGGRRGGEVGTSPDTGGSARGFPRGSSDCIPRGGRISGSEGRLSEGSHEVTGVDCPC